MLVFRGIPLQAVNSTVLTIGNFDGVHCGHQALLLRLVDYARRKGLPAAVMTFEPHPREFFTPETAPPRLSCLREKLERLAECGVDQVYVCRFDARFAQLSAESFVKDVLVRGLAVKHLIVGDDFRFGKARIGNFAMLCEAGRAHRFTLESLETVSVTSERVSSSAVRAALAAGDLQHAQRLLGRPYAISGRVVHGDKLGRQLGFPTANVALKRARAPLSGIFAVRVLGLDRPYQGAASLGVRPTVGGSQPRLEVYLFNFDQEIYGAHVQVEFLHRIRAEAKFANLELLKARIAQDVIEAKAFFEEADHG